MLTVTDGGVRLVWSSAADVNGTCECYQGEAMLPSDLGWETWLPSMIFFFNRFITVEADVRETHAGIFDFSTSPSNKHKLFQILLFSQDISPTLCAVMARSSLCLLLVQLN